MVIIGSVPVRLHAANTNSEGSKISFRIEDDFDKKKFHKKDRVCYAVDGRLKEWGSGGRDVKIHKKSIEELQLDLIDLDHLDSPKTPDPHSGTAPV